MTQSHNGSILLPPAIRPAIDPLDGGCAFRHWRRFGIRNRVGDLFLDSLVHLPDALAGHEAARKQELLEPRDGIARGLFLEELLRHVFRRVVSRMSGHAKRLTL